MGSSLCGHANNDKTRNTEHMELQHDGRGGVTGEGYDGSAYGNLFEKNVLIDRVFMWRSRRIQQGPTLEKQGKNGNTHAQHEIVLQ